MFISSDFQKTMDDARAALKDAPKHAGHRAVVAVIDADPAAMINFAIDELKSGFEFHDEGCFARALAALEILNEKYRAVSECKFERR